MLGLKAETSLSLDLLEGALRRHAHAETTALTLRQMGQEPPQDYWGRLIAMRHVVFEHYCGALDEGERAAAEALVANWREPE